MKKMLRPKLFPSALLLSVLLIPLSTHAVELISQTAANVQGNDNSYASDITPDGRFVVLESEASNLVPGDSNGTRDLFVVDRTDNSIELITVNFEGNQVPISGFVSLRATISDDGRYVCFRSEESGFVANDTNGKFDAFVRDRTLDTTTRVSLTEGDAEIPGGIFNVAISGDGSVVIFDSGDDSIVSTDANGHGDVFVRKLGPGTTEIVSLSDGEMAGNSWSGEDISVNQNGQLVAFLSDASNLITGDTNDAPDLFVRDIVNDSTIRVSVDSTGGELPTGSFGGQISNNGEVVAFVTDSDGAAPGDTNGLLDTYVFDFEKATTPVELISARDRTTSPPSDQRSNITSISPDGRYVAFSSRSAQLSTPPANRSLNTPYLRDRQTQRTFPLDLTETFQPPSKDGNPSNVETVWAPLASNHYAFHTSADNLVPGDNNEKWDVFLKTYAAPPVIAAPKNTALISSLKRKIKKTKKAMKKALSTKKAARVKSLRKKLKRFTKQLRAL